MLSDVSASLQRHAFRDKTLRLASYVSILLSDSGTVSPSLRTSLLNAAKCFSSTRTVLRLMDDLPMLHHTLTYGLGGKGKDTDPWLRVLSVVKNVFDQLFYPFEHLSWAIQNKILVRTSNPWADRGLHCWAFSLYLNLAKSIRSLILLREERKRILKAGNGKREQLGDLCSRERFHYLSLLQSGCDLCNAIHWMPEGRLWAGKLQQWQVGMFGTVATLVGIYKNMKYST